MAKSSVPNRGNLYAKVGGNFPSKTAKPSGKGRGNNAPRSGK